MILTGREQFERLDHKWTYFCHTTTSSYQIGPFVLSLIFASPSLKEKITPAFNHLKLNQNPTADLTVYLWDTTEQKLPTLDWHSINRNGYHGHYEDSIYFHYFDDINALSVLNAKKNKAHYIVRNVQKLPWWVSGSPLQVILHAWLREKGLQLTHTAAVANEQGAVLLTGKGGSGKSTATLSCLTEGLYYLSEDYCILAPGKSPQVFSLYQSAKWTSHTRKLFPHYDQFIANPDTANKEKALIYYQDIFPLQIKTSAPIRAIVSLKIEDTHLPVLEKQDLPSSLKSLIMSTLIQLPFSHCRTISLLKDVTAQIPCYQLTLGKDLKENTRRIQEILL